MINDRGLLPGDSLPTETELQAQFGVSRSVVRQAMATLANEGLVVRGRGRGTVVAPRRQFHRFVHRAAGLSAQMAEAGLTVTTRVIGLGPLDHRPNTDLPLPEGEIYRLERVRSIDGVPTGFIRTWLPAVYGRDLSVESLTNASLHALIEETHHVYPMGGKRQIRAVPADERLAELLDTHPSAPLLLIEGTTTDQYGEILEVFSTWHRGDLIALDLDVEDHCLPTSQPETPLALARRLVSALESEPGR